MDKKTYKEAYEKLLSRLRNCGNLITQEYFDENTGESHIRRSYHLIQIIEDYMCDILEEQNALSTDSVPEKAVQNHSQEKQNETIGSIRPTDRHIRDSVPHGDKSPDNIHNQIKKELNGDYSKAIPSLCNKCNCMTYTLNGKCGKCRKDKLNAQGDSK